MSNLRRSRFRARLVTAIALLGALVVAGLAVRPLVLDELAIRKLASPDEDIRKEAGEWLARRECVRAIPALLAARRTKSLKIQPDILFWQLDSLRIPRAAPWLREAARSSDDAIRSWAFEGLSLISDRSDEAFQIHEAALKGPIEPNRICGIMHLGRFGLRALSLLESSASSDYSLMRDCALVELTAIGPSGLAVVPILLGKLQEAASASTLWALGEDMTEVDDKLLESESLVARSAAAARLGYSFAPEDLRIGAAKKLDSLAMLEGQARRVRALIEPWKGPEGTTFLLEAAKEATVDADPEARRAFFEALAALGHAQPGLLAILQPLLDAGDSRLQFLASRIAARIEGGADLALAVLLPRVETGELEAIDAVAEAGPAARRAGPALVKLLEDAGATTRAHAAIALAHVDPEEGARPALHALLEWLRRPEAALHKAAAQALLAFPAAASTVPELSEFLLGEETDKEALALAALLVMQLGEAGRPALAGLEAAHARSGEPAQSVISLGIVLLGAGAPPQQAGYQWSDAVLDWIGRHLPRPSGRLLENQLCDVAVESWLEQRPTGTLSPPIPDSLRARLRDPASRSYARVEAAKDISGFGPAAADALSDILALAEEVGGPGFLLPLLARIGPAAVPHLVKALETGVSVELRGVIALALGRMGGAAGEAAPALTRLLDDANPGVREVAIDALGRMGRAAACAADKLEAIATAGPDDHRARAARALARIATQPDGLPPLPCRYGKADSTHGTGASDVHALICAR